MRLLKSTYSLIGRMTYQAVLPILRLYLKRTTRAYLVILCKDEILVIKSWLNSGAWHLPGGGLRKNEMAGEAIRRELLEEVGVELPISTLRPLASGIWKTRNLNYRYEILKTELDQKPDLKLRRPEILDAKWFKLDKISKENIPIEIALALRKMQAKGDNKT